MNNAVEQVDGVTVIDTAEIVARLYKKRWLIGAVAVLFAAGSGAMAFVMTPIYRATVIMVPASSGGGGLGKGLGGSIGALGGLASLAGLNLNSNAADTEEALAVLRSREFTEGFIRDQHLMPELFAGRWDRQTNNWKADEKQPLSVEGFKLFDGFREIAEDKKTGLITVSLDWRDPAAGALWANELVEHLNAEMRRRAVINTDASVGYLQKELANTAAVDTRQAINRLLEEQVNRRMFANVTQEYAFRVVDRALVPDSRDQVRPRKVFMISAGFALGLVLAIIWTLAVRVEQRH